MVGHSLPPLGRTASFHHALAGTTTDKHTLKVILETQSLLAEPPWRPKHRRQAIKVTKNLLAANSARDAALFRSVPCSVRGSVPMSEKTSLNFRNRSVACPRAAGGVLGGSGQGGQVAGGSLSARAHPCDVLGPQACSDCIRERQRRRVREEANYTFPGLETDQLSLCWPRRLQALITPRRVPAGCEASPAPTDNAARAIPDPATASDSRPPMTRGVDYGDFENIRLAADYTMAPTECFAAARGRLAAGAVSEPELHRRAMVNRARRRRKRAAQTGTSVPSKFGDHRPRAPTPPRRTVSIVIPTGVMMSKPPG